MNTEPSVMVSVFMTTYYHEKYVAQAIESVLNQKVNFSYEIIVSDDGSQDKTVDIVRGYEKRYSFIHLNANPENIGLTANVYKCKSLCKGKYLADLSGDDYWIDSNKLQRQIDFLESHPNYVAVATHIEGRYDFEETAFDVYPKDKGRSPVFTLERFLHGENCCLNGIVMKNFYLSKEDRQLFSIMPRMSKYIDDLTDELLLHIKGLIYVQPEVTAVYRVRKDPKGNKNYNSSNTPYENYKKHVELLNNLEFFFKGKFDFFIRYRMVTSDAFVGMIKPSQYHNFEEIFRIIPKNYRKRGLRISAFILSIPRIIIKIHDRIWNR